MTHPMLNFFGLEGSRKLHVDAYYPTGSELSVCCIECRKVRHHKNSVKGNVRATLSKIRKNAFYEGSLAISSGSEWPEAIEVTAKPPLIRADVVEKMLQAGISGFNPIATDLTIDTDRSLKRTSPEYFHLEVTGKVEVRFPEHEVMICPGCLCFIGNFGHKLMVPDLKSWSGDDLVMTSNVKTGFVLTTRKLIDLAKSENWKSFEFGSTIPHVLVRLFETDDWLVDISERTQTAYPQLFDKS
jgi:hypothetical protein